MRCANVMQRDVFMVQPGDTVLAAAALMRDEDIGFLPVVDDEGRAVGGLTDRDIAVRFAPYDERPSAITVADIMTEEVISCAPDDELKVAEQLMRQHRVSRVMVVDDERSLVGLITLTDIAALGSQRHAAKTLRRLAERDFRP